MQKKILYRSKNDGTDIRIGKECKSLVAAGHQVLFVGWDRGGAGFAEDVEPLPGVEKRILRQEGGYESARVLLVFWRYLLFAWRQVRQFRPDYIQAVNEDGVIVALLCKLGLKTRVVADIFDSMAFRYADKNFLLRSAVRFFSKLAWRSAYRIIVTDDERASKFESYRDKLIVLPNYPSAPGFSPLEIKQRINRSDQLQVYFGGTLNSARGLHLLEALVKSPLKVKVICAGWVYDEVAQRFVDLEDVEFRGVLSAEESLRVAAESDAIFAFYEPSNLNNIMASPNKVYDALIVGTPLLMNSEAQISKWVVERQLGFSSPYADVDGILSMAESLLLWNQQRSSHAQRLLSLSAEGYSWPAVENRLTDIFR